MRYIILLSKIFIIAFNQSSLLAGPNYFSNLLSPIESLNNSLNSLEEYQRQGNQSGICLEAIKSEKIIIKNIKNLKKIEPYYDWVNIRNVLISIQNDTCKG